MTPKHKRMCCACKNHFAMCVRCGCVQQFFRRAMCDPIFAHFCTLSVTKININCYFIVIFMLVFAIKYSYTEMPLVF